MTLLAASTKAYRAMKGLRRQYTLRRELAHWTSSRDEIVQAGRRRPHSGLDALSLDRGQIRLIERDARRRGTAVVATIDQDGYWQSHVGPIADVPTPDDGQFLRRNKFDIDVVWTPQYFGVRKRYRGNALAFLNELSSLVRLAGIGVRVPALLDVDFGPPALVMSYLPGRVLREELVRAGAPIRNRDRPPGLERTEHWQRALRAGRAVLPQVVTRDLVARLECDLERIHRAGVLIRDVKWGNIIIGRDGLPWWLDFHMAEDHSELSPKRFRVLAALDIAQFNRAFGTGGVAP